MKLKIKDKDKKKRKPLLRGNREPAKDFKQDTDVMVFVG